MSPIFNKPASVNLYLQFLHQRQETGKEINPENDHAHFWDIWRGKWQLFGRHHWCLFTFFSNSNLMGRRFLYSSTQRPFFLKYCSERFRPLRPYFESLSLLRSVLKLCNLAIFKVKQLLPNLSEHFFKVTLADIRKDQQSLAMGNPNRRRSSRVERLFGQIWPNIRE